jgi:hypothetical protein
MIEQMSSNDGCRTLYLGDELKQTVSIVVDIASVLDPDGVDIYFLNREPMLHVRNSSELIPVFAVPPGGKGNIDVRSTRVQHDLSLAQDRRPSFLFFVVFFEISNMR